MIKKWQDRVGQSCLTEMAMQAEIAELRTAVAARDKTYSVIKKALNLFREGPKHRVINETCVSANLLLVEALIVMLESPSFDIMAADFEIESAIKKNPKCATLWHSL